MDQRIATAEGRDLQDLNEISDKIIGAAFEVSRVLGTRFLEKVYENAIVCELKLGGLEAASQLSLQVTYKGQDVGHYLADIVVEHRIILECKCAEAFVPEHVAQCLNYLRATGLRLGLLLNFQNPKVTIKRIIL